MLWKSICIAEKRTFNWVSLSGLLTAERKKFPWRCISPLNLALKGNVIRAVMKIEFFQCLRMAFFNELSTLPPLKWMQTFWPALTLLFSPSFHPVWQASPLPFLRCPPTFYRSGLLMFFGALSHSSFAVNWKVPNFFPSLTAQGQKFQSPGIQEPLSLTDGVGQPLSLWIFQSCREDAICIKSDRKM